MRTNQTKELSGLPPIEPGARKQPVQSSGLGDLPPLPAPKESRGWLSRYFFRSTAFVIFIVLIMVVLEISFRRMFTRDTAFDWLQYHPTRLYINNPNVNGVQLETEWNVNEMGFRGPLPGLKTKKRILCLGDSRTFGNKVSSNECYPGRLAALLPDYEVINAGTFYYTSYQGRVLFEEVYPKLHPDIVTIAFGYYDRCYVPEIELIDNHDTFKRFYQCNYFLNHLRHSLLYQQVKNYIAVNAEIIIPPVFSLQPRVNTLQYRENLKAILDSCFQQGIKVILLDIEDKPEAVSVFNAGITALENQNLAEAAQHFQNARSSSNIDAQVLGTYYLTLCYQMMGNQEAADSVQTDYPYLYHFPGIHAIRHSKPYSNVLQDLAKEYGVPLIQSSELIGEESLRYLDTTHPDAAGYAFIADRIVKKINGM